MEEKKSRFRGMKKKPYANLQNGQNCNKEKPRKKKVMNGSIAKAKGLSAYQLRTQEEFMKVRPGETEPQWRHRTRYRRIRTEEEIAATAIGKKKIAVFKARSKKTEESRVRIEQPENDFNFLKFYVFVINWASIKYGISQQDLEIGFHFHMNLPFTKDQFLNKCLLFTKRGHATFVRLNSAGHINEFKTVQLTKSNEKKSTHMYCLSRSFKIVLNEIYKKITYGNSFEFKPTTKRTMSPELEKLLIEMAHENNEILLGNKEPHKFLIK